MAGKSNSLFATGRINNIGRLAHIETLNGLTMVETIYRHKPSAGPWRSSGPAGQESPQVTAGTLACVWEAKTDLDDGYTIRCSSVLRTPSASAQSREDMECCVSPRPVRAISLVQVVFDESPPGAVGPSIAYEGARCVVATQPPLPHPWSPREGDDVPARDEFRTSAVGASWQGPFTQKTTI